LLVLRNNKLFVNADKCTFCVDNVIFLGIVNNKGVPVDPAKIKSHSGLLHPKKCRRC